MLAERTGQVLIVDDAPGPGAGCRERKPITTCGPTGQSRVFPANNLTDHDRSAYVGAEHRRAATDPPEPNDGDDAAQRPPPASIGFFPPHNLSV